eukprot:12016-Heterococcus_DN1.PRE.1
MTADQTPPTDAGVIHAHEYVNFIREPHNPYDRNAIRVVNMAGIQVRWHKTHRAALCILSVLDQCVVAELTAALMNVIAAEKLHDGAAVLIGCAVYCTTGSSCALYCTVQVGHIKREMAAALQPLMDDRTAAAPRFEGTIPQQRNNNSCSRLSTAAPVWASQVELCVTQSVYAATSADGKLLLLHIVCCRFQQTCELAVFGLPEHAVSTLNRLQRLTAIHTPQQHQHRGSTAAYHHAGGGGSSSSSSAAYQQQLVPTVTSVAVRAPVKSQQELDAMFDKSFYKRDVRPATILYERPALDVQSCTYSHTYVLARMHGTHTQLLETTGAQQAEADAVGVAASALITSPLFDHQKQGIAWMLKRENNPDPT